MIENMKYKKLELSIKSFDTIREEILNLLLIAISVSAFLPLCASIYRVFDIDWQNIMYFHVIAYLTISIAVILRKKLAFYYKALILIIISFIGGCIAIINMGLLGSGIFFFVFSIIFSTMFIGVRAGLIVIMTSFIFLTTVALGFNHGWIVFDLNVEAVSVALSTWISRIFAFTLFSTAIIFTIGRLINHLLNSCNVLKERTQELHQANAILLEQIEENKKTEAVRKKSEEKYRLLAENVTDVIWTTDLDLNLTYVSPSVQRKRGFTVEEIMAQKAEEQFTPESLAVAMDIFAEELAIERQGDMNPYRSRTLYAESICKHGSTLWNEIKLSFIRDTNGKATGILGVSRDITERRRSEKARIEAQQRYQALFDSKNTLVFVMDPAGRFVDVNASALDLFGYKKVEISDLNYGQLLHPDQNIKDVTNALTQILKTHSRIESLEIKMKSKNGKTIYLQSGATLIPEKNEIIGVAIDITEQKVAEESKQKILSQISQVQRLESVGTLAGGIAHDFNNLLTGILGNTSLMLLDIGAGHTHYERLKNIEEYVQDGANLTNQLLGYARKGKYEIKAIDLNKAIKQSAEMFGRTKKEINIHTKFQNQLWPAEVDQGQIKQVLLNLLVNAWHALVDGGDIYISTENVILDARDFKHYSVKSGRYIKLTIQDTGIGMDDATQQRIFEPFFTTKEMGRGTGLGLASVYGIVKNHKGYIEVSSEKGQGTTFEVYLPGSEKEVSEEKEITEAITKGSETVLLVDDEDMIIDVGKHLMERLGYRVMIAKSGRQALAVYEKNQEKIDMIVLDMIMPDMGGGETYDKLLELNPDIKVLLSSGYGLNDQATEIIQRGCNGFVQKPFDIKGLSQKLREIC